MNLGNHLEDQVLRKRNHCRPVLDVRTELDLNRRIRNALAVKDAVLVDAAVEEVFRLAVLCIDICCCCQIALVYCCCCDGTCIHQRYRRNLSVLQFGTFAVREVSCGVTDTERIVCRSIACAEARSAECCLHDRTALDQFCESAVLSQLHVDRCTCRVNTECELVCTDVFVL